jgi:isopenicillin N synthase-like dioxygenase
MSDYLSKVPTLDISKFTDGDNDDIKSFSQDLGISFNQTGFAIIKNHGLTQEITTNLYSKVQSFFELDDEKKIKYYFPELYGQRGYVVKGQEHAKGSSKGDLKEFFHIGNPEISNPKNIWPIEIDNFEEVGTNAFLTLENIGLTLLKAIAIYLNIEEDYFTNKVKGGESIMRSIHYYPLKEEDVEDGAVRAAAHGDINLITLLMGASADGLEILTKEEKWIPIISESDQLVINVGDMLERLTNKKLMSTVHRVVNPSKEKLNTSRYSIPFFMHPKPEMDLTCLSNCIDESNPKSYDDVTAGQFLEERLREIGLKK